MPMRSTTDLAERARATLAREVSARAALAHDRSALTAVDEALAAVDWANNALQYNPNEALLLQGLMVRLSELSVSAPGAAAGR